MADLVEDSIWEPGIYQIEETDVVRGGDPANGGVSNIQPQQLANRTKYLYDQLGKVSGIIVDNINGTTTINSADLLNKHHVLSIGMTGANVIVNAADLPDGAILSFSVISNEEYKHVHLIPQSGMQFVGITAIFSNVDLPIYSKEAIRIAKNGTDLIIIDCKMQLDEVGEILYKPKAPMHALKMDGQLYERSAYPRLWAFANQCNPVSDSAWLTNGLKYIGCFSTGNGTTNFRMPDLRGMFVRGLDNGAGRDLDRLFTGEGGGQDESIKKHSHSIGRGDAYTGSSQQQYNIVGGGQGTNRQSDVNTGEVGGVETRPKNAAYTAYIKY